MQTIRFGTPIGPLCLQQDISSHMQYTPREVNKCLGIVSDGVAGLETTACRLLELHPRYMNDHHRIVFEIRLFRSDLRLYRRDGDELVWAEEGERPVLFFPGRYGSYSLRDCFAEQEFVSGPQYLRDEDG